jgi:hypothetical protein
MRTSFGFALFAVNQSVVTVALALAAACVGAAASPARSAADAMTATDFPILFFNIYFSLVV